MSTLQEPLRHFVDVYHNTTALVIEQTGWNCSIVLSAEENADQIGLKIEDGRVVDIGANYDAANVDLVVTAESTILIDILELRCDPSEPYMFGELTVEGEERHFNRLDYVVTTLCPD